MNRIIVTGSDGFVGRHLVELLKKDRCNRVYPLDFKKVDITKHSSVKKYLEKIKPDQVYHLAGFASGAGKDKDLIFKVNVDGTLNILKALTTAQPHLRSGEKVVKLLLASTAYVYGNTSVCASEKAKIDAKSFYDQSKIKMEREALSNYSSSVRSESGSPGDYSSRQACLAGRQARTISNNIQIIITRATNHTGPGQKLGFVVPDFCAQIVNAKDGDEILVGNLSAKRDFFDVRDCVRAYKIIMGKGESGAVYNIGTGKTVEIKTILEMLIKISGKKISYRLDTKRLRPSDIKKNCVNASKVKKLGWTPKISLDKTLEDTYKYYKYQHVK